MTMDSQLGCALKHVKNLVTYFKHPVIELNVYVFPDPCHMIKLVRNTYAEKEILIDGDGDKILWSYIQELHYLQEQEGLHLANKLLSIHINYFKQEMKVRLTTQVFGNSIADALHFYNSELHLKEFENCQSTIKFLKVFNNLFDVFNTKNFKQCRFSKPVYNKNKYEIFEFLNMYKKYILNLQTHNEGDLLVYSSSKTGFIGVFIAISSLQEMYVEICKEQ